MGKKLKMMELIKMIKNKKINGNDRNKIIVNNGNNIIESLMEQMKTHNNSLIKSKFNPLMLERLNFSVYYTKIYGNEIGFFYNIENDNRKIFSEFFYGSMANISLERRRTNEINIENKGFFHTHPTSNRLLFSPMDISTMIINNCKEGLLANSDGSLMFIKLENMKEKYLEFIETESTEKIEKFETIRDLINKKMSKYTKDMEYFNEFNPQYRKLSRKWNRANKVYEFYLEQFKLHFFRFLIKNGNLRIIKLFDSEIPLLTSLTLKPSINTNSSSKLILKKKKK